MQSKRFIFGIGSGRCGLRSLALLLNKQADAAVSFEQPPLLPWDVSLSHDSVVNERLKRIAEERPHPVVGDVAAFYLPYIRAILKESPEAKIVCLKRDRTEVINSFERYLDKHFPIALDHWSKTPAAGWYHEPDRTRTFPQYEDLNARPDGIGRYWDEYYEQVEALENEFPDSVRCFSIEALSSREGQVSILEFVGFAPPFVTNPNVREHTIENTQSRERGVRYSPNRNDPRRCAVLVPYTGNIIPKVFEALSELRNRGYVVRTVPGYAAIDQGRNQMATDALIDGFEETMWIDSDVVFHPDDVDRLRSHGLPLVCGIYPQKGVKALACHLPLATEKITFGEGGGLTELLFAGTGFLHIRREVYGTVQEQLKLPMCNERFRRPMIPFFLPMAVPFQDGHWYLAEDYAFCTRAKECGYRIMADTSIRLWHVGSYNYGWEDAGGPRERFETFTLNFSAPPQKPTQVPGPRETKDL